MNKTASITVTNKVTPATPISTVYATAFATVTSGTVCSTTVAAFPTVTNFVAGIGAVQKRGIDENVAEEALAKRQASMWVYFPLGLRPF